MISEKLITNLTKAFDDDGDIILGCIRLEIEKK